MKKHRKYHFMVALAALVISWLAWPIIFNYSTVQIQPIASAVSTLAGMLFGFVMASVSLLATAKDNTLVRNTALTGYLPKLVDQLHWTMAVLLLVCLLFLITLFLPDTLVFHIGDSAQEYKFSSLFVTVGVFFLINSFYLFFLSWHSFKTFTKNM